MALIPRNGKQCDCTKALLKIWRSTQMVSWDDAEYPFSEDDMVSMCNRVDLKLGFLKGPFLLFFTLEKDNKKSLGLSHSCQDMYLVIKFPLYF